MPQLLAAVAPSLFAAGGTAALFATTAAGATVLSGLGIAVSIGSSLLLSAATRALAGGQPSAAEVERRLSIPTTLPSYRFVYGEVRATGTPVAWVVRGDYAYFCYLLNSRPSALPDFTLYLDGREVALTGDAFDFAGGGAVADDEPLSGHLALWVSRGDETSPPDAFLLDAPWEAERTDGFLDTDGWQGRTVAWLRIKAEGDGRDTERFAALPPGLKIDGQWSLVWNPGDEAQDPDDPATWTFSENHRRCVLDALLQNPVRPWPRDQLLLDSFVEAQGVAADAVALGSGGSEARWRCGGTLLFGETAGEVEDFLAPMLVSGAADLVRIGGQLGITTGQWTGSVLDLTEDAGEQIDYRDMLPEDEIVDELRVSYLSRERGSEMAELQPWPIPGAPTTGLHPQSLELPFCPSATQGMRVRKQLGLRMVRERRLSFTAPPYAFDLVATNTVTVALENFAPFDGVYEVQSLDPHLSHLGEDGGCAMRIPLVLVGPHSADIYDWDASEEEEVYDEPYDGTRAGVQMPGAITATIEDVSSGTATLQRVRFRFDPSASSGVDSYEWQTRTGSAPYGESRFIEGSTRDVAPNDGKVFGLIDGVSTDPRDIRVRTVTSAGKSEWREITDIQPLAITGGAGVAGPGAGEATFTGNAPASVTVDELRVYRAAPGDDFEDATVVGAPILASAGAAFSSTQTGLSAGAGRFWVVPVTISGALGTPDGPYDLTIT